MSNCKKIVNFYLNNSETSEGLTLVEILAFQDEQLEKNHLYIQWLFPLPEISFVNPDAPLFDQEFANQYNSSLRLKIVVGYAIDRMIEFWDLGNKNKPNWFKPNNHNFLRLTRFLRFLTLLGEFQMARTIFNKLSEFDRFYPNNVSEETFEYWRAAVFGN